MKAISLWQPWAQFVAIGQKTYETRSWPTSHRGDIVVCAAKRKTKELPMIAMAWLAKTNLFSPADTTVAETLDRMPHGAALCVVAVESCEPTEQLDPMFCPARLSPRDRDLGDFSHGRWAWKLANLRKLRRPVPVVGKQGVFDLTPAEEAAVRGAMP